MACSLHVGVSKPRNVEDMLETGPSIGGRIRILLNTHKKDNGWWFTLF